MKFIFIAFVATCCVAVTYVSAEQESKYNEIIKLLANSDQQLKAEAQTYSASIADPNDYSSQGYSRSSDRSRYSSSQASSSSNYNDKDDEDAKKLAEDEEEKKPDRLALLLQDSKFSCDGLKNGYYADESVGCQVFHYCVDNVKHSWQCPENTVFHQIHLNCVPDTQNICTQSSKFHIVNDYLHKELDERGPNNTVLYHQRFYPEGFDYSGGDAVTQIFQAQAQAALNKAHSQSDSSDYNNYEDDSPAPVRSRASRPKSYGYNGPSTQAVRSQVASKPVYKQASARPVLVPSGYSASPQPVPTKRPVSYTTPEAYTAPAYTESSQEDYSPNDYSSSSVGSSSSSGSSLGSGSSQNYPNSGLSSSSNYGSGVSSYGSSSSSTYGGNSNHGSSTGYRPHSSSSSRPSNYPTRSLGIPIASFRVAPSSQSQYSPSNQAAAQASSIHELSVEPMIAANIAAAYQNNPALAAYYY